VIINSQAIGMGVVRLSIRLFFRLGHY